MFMVAKLILTINILHLFSQKKSEGFVKMVRFHRKLNTTVLTMFNNARTTLANIG